MSTRIMPTEDDLLHCYYTPGTAVERELDGQWYLARVTASSTNPKGLYTIQYVDDGNEEEMVEHFELRRPAGKTDLPSQVQKATVPKPPMCLPIQELLLGDESWYEDKTPRVIMHNKTGLVKEDEEEGEGKRIRLFGGAISSYCCCYCYSHLRTATTLLLVWLDMPNSHEPLCVKWTASSSNYYHTTIIDVSLVPQLHKIFPSYSC